LLQAIREHSSAASPSVLEEVALPVLKSSIAEQVPAYLRNCRQNVIDIGDALDRVDFEAVTILGHNMSGSGGMFGFQAITDIGTAIQLAAESSDNEASRKWAAELSSYLDRVEASPALA
jgi:HPt (histidine-containing phosphotransfer) domain-containing protein